MNIFFLVLIACLAVSNTARAVQICSGSYVKDKDKLQPIDLGQISAHELLKQYLDCGLQSVSQNGWSDIAGFSPEQIRKQISKVDVRYTESLPPELLPVDGKGRKTAVFHHLKDGQWQILIAGSELQKYYPGERYLLLFHELVSTMDPLLDVHFGASIDFEFKALQANSSSLQASKISDVLLPKLGKGISYSKATGPITSGGGDGTLIWLKRQLRNYFIDAYVVLLLKGSPILSKSELESIFQVISYCPMDLTEDATESYRIQVSAEGRPLLSVDRSYFHRDYEKYLAESHDPREAAIKASQHALAHLGDVLKEVAPIWVKTCIGH